MCESYMVKEGGGLPANVQVLPADAEIYAFDFIFEGEDHTLGHMLQTWIDINLYGRGVVNYVGYDPMHPLTGKLYVRIGVVDNSEDTARGVLQEALAGCAALFRAWRSYWTTVSGGIAVDDEAVSKKQTSTKRILTRPIPPPPVPKTKI